MDENHLLYWSIILYFKLINHKLIYCIVFFLNGSFRFWLYVCVLWYKIWIIVSNERSYNLFSVTHTLFSATHTSDFLLLLSIYSFHSTWVLTIIIIQDIFLTHISYIKAYTINTITKHFFWNSLNIITLHVHTSFHTNYHHIYPRQHFHLKL